MPLSNRTVLTYADKSAPLAAIATARLAAYPIDLVADPKHPRDAPAVLSIDGSEELDGQVAVLRFLARSATTQPLYGIGPLSATRVDQWLDFSAALVSGAGLEGTCQVINEYLSLRTFLVDYSVTVADIACWGQLQGTMQWDKLKLSGNLPHLARWYDFLCGLPELQDVAEQYGPKRRKPITAPAAAAKEAAAGQKGGKAAAKAAAAAPGDTGSFEIDLPDASEGNVTTRFPPEPSGYLHIGHAKAAMLNQYFAEHYKGRLLMRFDDTNPSKEKDEYVDQILKDVAALGIKYDKLSYTSDWFPQLTDCAERLIKLGHLYADDTPVDQMRLERGEGTESKCRGRSKDENLQIWEEMKAGSDLGKQNCLRFRMDMSNPNKALRDPTAARCNPAHHWRTGHTYKVYPTYDFACPFVDAIEGVTHALRTSEYRDRQEQYYRILKMCQEVWPGLPQVHLWDFSRLTFVNTLMSKRKLDWFVRTGRVDGWTDPRFPTVQGLYRRGLQLEAMREFILSQGASKNVTLMEWDKIWTINKKIIDPVCPRHTAIADEGRIRLHLTNGPKSPTVISVLKNKKHPPAGVKATTQTQDVWLEQADAAVIKDGEEVTLMDWGNAIIRNIARSPEGAITGLTGELHLEGNFKTTRLKLTWLPDTQDLVPLELHDFDHLLTKKKLEEEDSFEDFINPCSRWTVRASGDANMRCLQKGDILQLERKGYFRVDQPLLKPNAPIVLFAIPDGRARSTIPQSAASASSAPQRSAAPSSSGPASAAASKSTSGTSGSAAAAAALTTPAAASTPSQLGNQSTAADNASAAAGKSKGPSEGSQKGVAKVSLHHTGNPAPVGSQPAAASSAAFKSADMPAKGVARVSLHHTGAPAPVGNQPSPAASSAASAGVPGTAGAVASPSIPPPPMPVVGAAEVLANEGALSPPAVLQRPTSLPPLSTRPSVPIEGLPAGSPIGSPMKQQAPQSTGGPHKGPSLLGGALRGQDAGGLSAVSSPAQPGGSSPGTPAATGKRPGAPGPFMTPPPTPAASMELPRSMPHTPL